MFFLSFFTIILGMTGFNKLVNPDIEALLYVLWLVGVIYLAGSGGSRGGPPLFFDQKFFLRPPPFPLISGSG